MDVRELTPDERQVLFGLLAHMVAADRRIDPGEAAELDALGEEMGVGSLNDAFIEARRTYPTTESALDAAPRIDRKDARELVRTLLHDLAAADGERSIEEDRILQKLDAVWPR